MNRIWLVYQIIVKSSYKLIFDDVMHMLSLHFPVLSCIFWIWRSLSVIIWSCLCQRFPSTVILFNARHCRSSIFLSQFQMDVSNYFKVLFVNSQYLVDSSLRTCCLQFDTFFCPFCNSFFLAVFLYFRRSFNYSLSVVRKIWNLAIPVHSSGRVTSFVSSHQSLTRFSSVLFIFVWICHFTSTYFNGIGNVSLSGS